MFGNDAFLNVAGTEWRINSALLDSPEALPNTSNTPAVEMKVRIAVGAHHRHFPRLGAASVEFKVDTGAEVTVLAGDAARRLGFRFLYGAKDVHLIGIGGTAMLAKLVEVILYIGGRQQRITAAIPIGSRLVPWPQSGVPWSGSLLGLECFWMQHMLCFTPEYLYVFPLK